MEKVTRDGLLRQIRTDRAAFEAIVARVPSDRLSEPMLAGGWSVKDVLAHIAWGEQESVIVAQARAMVGSELWDLNEDERNALVVEASRAQP